MKHIIKDAANTNYSTVTNQQMNTNVDATASTLPLPSNTVLINPSSSSFKNNQVSTPSALIVPINTNPNPNLILQPPLNPLAIAAPNSPVRPGVQVIPQRRGASGEEPDENDQNDED